VAAIFICSHHRPHNTNFLVIKKNVYFYINLKIKTMKKIWKYLLIAIIANCVKPLNCKAQITLDTIIPTTYTGLGTGFWAGSN